MIMRINYSKALAIVSVMSVMTLGSCTDQNADQYVPAQGDDSVYNTFDFSTTKEDVSLNISYVGCGVKSPVLFEIYDENPVVESFEGNGMVKKEGVRPFFSAYTGEDCVFNGTVSLPSYLEKVWVYSPSFFAKTLMEAEVVGNSITASDTGGSMRIGPVTRASETDGFSYMTCTDAPKEYQTGTRWKEWLGMYDGNGRISYAYTGSELVPDASVYDLHSQIISVNNSACPQKYRNASDLEIDDPAEVVVTFLGGNTCWNSSIGYYFYKVGEEPASLDDVNVIMLFPNTQDGKWFKINKDSERAKAGIDRMTSVKLKFYPHIAEDSQEGATDVFPAGYKVGLVLATNAWSNRLEYSYDQSNPRLSENRYYRAASLPTLSVRQNGNPTDQPLVASYYTPGKDFVIVSFEDDYKFEDNKGADQNFSDVVLAIGTNPVSAVADLPELDDRLNNDGSGLVTLHETLQGTYLFEDLWPEKGDYDMNDACVEYIYGRSYDKWNDTYGETFSFKARENYALKKNGIAFRVVGGERSEVNAKGNETGKKIYGNHVPAEVRLYMSGKDITEQLEYDAENQIYYVIPDTKQNPGIYYTVEFVHIPVGSPLYYERNYKKYKSQIDVFLYRKDGDKNWEVHTSGREPSPKVNRSYFGTGDDLSRPDEGIYYVRSGNYPFALFLNGQQIDKLGKLFDRSNEGMSLDQLFPKYVKWVETNGAENANWYK